MYDIAPQLERQRQLYLIARESINAGLSREKVQALLIQHGASPNDAPRIIWRLLDAARASAEKTMFQGTIWCLVGLALAPVTYFMNPPTGIPMLVAGPVLFGSARIMKGRRELARISELRGGERDPGPPLWELPAFHLLRRIRRPTEDPEPYRPPRLADVGPVRIGMGLIAFLALLGIAALVIQLRS